MGVSGLKPVLEVFKLSVKEAVTRLISEAVFAKVLVSLILNF